MKKLFFDAFFPQLLIPKTEPRGFYADCAAWTLQTFCDDARSPLSKARHLAELYLGAAKLNYEPFLGHARLKHPCNGCFYVISLDGEDGDRFKLGFSGNVNHRLETFQTVAPLAEIIHAWPSQQRWEGTAMDCASRICERIGQSEVFVCPTRSRLLVYLNDFFVLMGSVDPASFAAEVGPLPVRKGKP